MAVTREPNYVTEQYVGWETYLKHHHSMGGEVFKTRDSLEWFCPHITCFETEVLLTCRRVSHVAAVLKTSEQHILPVVTRHQARSMKNEAQGRECRGGAQVFW